jgi:hypothetical protein
MALLDEQAYIGYPQMGRRRAMPNTDVEMNQGLLRGASYYPYDLLGSPIDLINMGLKPLGMGSQKPVMGSDYLQSLAQQYGLSQQPTGSNAENVARLAMSTMNPATGARAVGRVVEPTMQALAPKAYGLLEDYMVKSGGMIPLTAYHGTPHTIKGGFDINKVGTGEGNQSFGYGMYFAEAPAVAKIYQAALSDTKYKVGERELKGNEAWAAQFLHDFQGDALPKRIDVNTAIEKANQTLKDTATKQEVISNIKSLDKSGLSVENGNLYKVDIPDKDIPNLLDWDKPINKQSELVQNVANELLPKIKQVSPNVDINKMTGQDFYRAYQRYRGNHPEFASEGLNEAGIKGVRYLDEGSRVDFKYSGDAAYTYAGNSFKESGYTPQDALEGMKQAYKNADPKELELAINDVYGIEPKKTSNFVVFDPTNVKILEKNDQRIEGLLD